MSQEGRRSNIIIFGQTGSGKSSLINMLACKDVAEVSSEAMGCTTTAKSYEVVMDNRTYTFWDTSGLNEGDEGRVPAQKAIENLSDLVKGISVSLIIYCVRGCRLTDIVRVNYDLFCGTICEGKVPVVLVVTGLEQEENMDQWWTENGKVVKRLGLTFEDYACVTTIKGRNNIYEQEYRESRDKVWKLVEEHCNSAPWTMTPGWLDKVSKTIATYVAKYNARTEMVSHNVVIFGETGSGKSSIVNMIVGEPVANVSSSPVGTTFKNERYETYLNNAHFFIYDTVGLNEGEQGRAPHWKAVRELYTLIRRLDGVSLLIYCMRGRIKENALPNWILFNKVLCAEEVPIIAVATGLEQEDDLDGKANDEIKKALNTYGMFPKHVECIVSVLGKNNEYEELYTSSQRRLRKRIEECYRRKPWSTETDDWIAHIYRTTYSTKFCFFEDAQVEFVNAVGNVVDKFIEETGMKGDDADKLKATLLQAETTLRKKSLPW